MPLISVNHYTEQIQRQEHIFIPVLLEYQKIVYNYTLGSHPISEPPGGNFIPLYVPLSRQWPKRCGKMNVFPVDVVCRRTERLPWRAGKMAFHQRELMSPHKWNSFPSFICGYSSVPPQSEKIPSFSPGDQHYIIFGNQNGRPDLTEIIRNLPPIQQGF